MSAYIFSDEYLSYLVSYASKKDASYWNPEKQERVRFNGNEQKIFDLLKCANWNSVNARYGGNDAPPETKVGLVLENFDPVQVLKACACFDYQACEVDDYENTEAARIIDAIRTRAIKGKSTGTETAAVTPVTYTGA